MIKQLFRSAPKPEPVRKRAVSTEPCGRCGHRLPERLPRCPRCGTRRFVPPDVDAGPRLEDSPPTVSPSPVPRDQLSELQRRILAAVRPGSSIFVYRDPGPHEGEVKAGNERFFGDEAIAALATLVGPGLVTEAGNDRFELTLEGARLAQGLR